MDESRFPANTAARVTGRLQSMVVAPSGDDVRGTGSSSAPFRTIRRALDGAAVVPGSEVLVHGGTYAEGTGQAAYALTIGGRDTVLRAVPGEAVTIAPASPNVQNGLWIAADRATVQGIRFDGFTSNAVRVGVAGRPIHDVVVSDVSVTMTAAGGDGVAIYDAAPATGVAVVSGLLLDGVTIDGADSGFTVSSGPVADLALRAVTIRNRTSGAARGGMDAIGIPSGDNILVNGAEVSGADGNGIDIYASRVAILNAHVHDVRKNGVQLHFGGDLVNALVHDCGEDASVVLEVDLPLAGAPLPYRLVNDVIAFHNRPFGGAAAYSMTVGYATPQAPVELELVNTVFYRNTGGICLSQGTHASISNCLFFGAANGAVADYGYDGSTNRSLDDSQPASALAAIGRASGNLPFRTDPGFSSPQATSLGGFRPAAGSALLRAGAAPPPFPVEDLLGSPRMASGAPDLGPIEAP